MDAKIRKIWDRYTETIKTVDFSGREIIKSAYGDENSYYCWNVDHILPNKNNAYENLQPTHIETNKQKFNYSAGKIIHKYNNFNVLTIFEIKKQAKHSGIIYIKRQYCNSEINISDIYFKNEIGYFEDGENTRFSQLNLEQSIKCKMLIFFDGNNPKKWRIL